MTLVGILVPDFTLWWKSLHLKKTYVYLLSGFFWMAGLFHPLAGVLFYFSLIYPTIQIYRRQVDPTDLFYFLLPYFLTVGASIWHQILPYALGIPLSILLCDLISKLMFLFIRPSAAGNGMKIILLPGGLALLDTIFNRTPVLSNMEMIPVLSPIYHHTAMLASAALLGRHAAYLVILTGSTAIMLLVGTAFFSQLPFHFSEKRTLAILAFLCTVIMFGSRTFSLTDKTESRFISVTAVQASLGLQSLPQNLRGEDIFRYRYRQYLLAAEEPDTDIVLFPEIMVGIYDTKGVVDQEYRENFLRQAARWDCLLVPLVMEGNSETQSPQDRRITALVVHPSGILGRSSKRYLVPFSETSQFAAGNDFNAIPTPLGRVGLSICYDANGSTIRKLAKDEAQIILAPFNDTGFSIVFHTVHRFYTIIQAIEYQIPVVVANESGISQIVNGTGLILASLPMGAVGSITAEVPLSTEPSLYLRFGYGLEMVILTILLFTRGKTADPSLRLPHKKCSP